MEENFTSYFCLSKIDSANNLFFLEVILDKTLKESAIFSSLGRWDLFCENSHISVFGLSADKTLINNWELHVFLFYDVPLCCTLSEVEVKSRQLWILGTSGEWMFIFEININ